MKERPILFSTSMVRAILEGRKTQTRRVMKLQHFELDGGGSPFTQRWDDDEQINWRRDVVCPHGQPGDRLWVRETVALDYFSSAPWLNPEGRHGYRADWTPRAADTVPEPKWTPSIHMPRWASRISLEITEVRVQRLQDITLDECEAEGVKYPPNARSVGNFAVLWDSINGKGAWRANPWVWAISFKRLESPSSLSPTTQPGDET